MAWTESSVLDERMRFVVAHGEGIEDVASLCRRFGVSRKTGYKWLDRYAREGPSGLEDRSRRPLSNSRSLCPELAERILRVRLCCPGWGPRKVRAWLCRQEPAVCWPAASTIGALFDRHGLTRHRRRRRRAVGTASPLGDDLTANEVWCIDFKGWFLTGDKTHVEPLTVSDAASRYLFHCQSLGRSDGPHVWPVLDRLFRDYGLPERLRSDNGAPFASVSAGGLSRLAVKVIKAGVRPERIEPGKPQHNGRHERLHLTLKQETADPPARSLAEQMERLERFRDSYNHERPHEALGQVPPAEVYAPSLRVWDGVLREPSYDSQSQIRRVRHNGEIKWRGRKVYLAQLLAGEAVGLSEIDDDTWLVKYGPVVLGTLKGRDKLRPGPR